MTCFKCGSPLFAVTEGTVLASRYEILSPLGRGGMGMVYKARDRELDEIVALKVLRPDVAATGDMARRFRSEIKIARKIRHRNVCAIHEFGQHGPLQFIAMELIEGVDLKKVLRERGSLAVDDAFDVSLQVAKGLQAIHDAGIVHRDLKATNIMRDPSGLVRLMDFGIAKDFRAIEQTMTGQIVGTPEYMSPEQARGQRVDHRSDIYALGIVVYELFTGEVPFKGDSPIATLYKQIETAPPMDEPRSAALPEPVKDVLRKALAKDPDHRHQSVREMADALRAARAAAGVTGTSGALPVTRLPGSRTDGAAALAREPLDDDDDDTWNPRPTQQVTQVPTQHGRTRTGVTAARPTLRGSAVASPTVLIPKSELAPRPTGPRLLWPAAGGLALVGAVVAWWAMNDGGVPVASVASPQAPPSAVAGPLSDPSPPPDKLTGTAQPAPSPTLVAEVPVVPKPDVPPKAPPPTVRQASVPPPSSTQPAVIRPSATLPPRTEPAPAMAPPPTLPPVTAPPPATTPPQVPATSAPPPWNSEAAVRQAITFYAGAFASLNTDAIKAIYPSIPKRDLDTLKNLKAYDVDIEVRRIEIKGSKAKVTCIQKAVLRSFTGNDRVLPPHETVLTLEYKRGAWVRVD